jgi:hypothetical protein
MLALATESKSLRGWGAGLASRSLSHRLCRNPGVHRPRLQITRGYRTQAEYRTLPHAHARRDGSTGTHPGIGAQAHRKGNERKRGIVIVVRGTTNVSLLRNDGVRSHGHRRWIINLRLVAQGNPIRAQKIPWRPDPSLWIKMAIRSELSPEGAQEKGAPGMERPG